MKQTMPWVKLAPGAPYFRTEAGDAWTPVGQNDAVTWPEFAGLFLRKDLDAVDAHLGRLAAQGVTCLRFMLEYCQTEHRYLERPAGTFQPNMVRLWDDLFFLCEKHRLRLLLTPYDTFWMWIRWKQHPYNKARGGPCAQRSEWLLCAEALDAIKRRLSFAVERWGGSGVLFAWDLWNEIHPAHAGNSTAGFDAFVTELSAHVRETEMRLHGRTHLQTVSLFSPVLQEHPEVSEVIFRHPGIDFASTHFYDAATINDPKDTVSPAVCAGALVREALAHLPPTRPFFDSEHGPIHAFKDLHRTLREPFDDEYFRHMQWAHLAAGAAGGGMRWPNRHPHTLTTGMRRAQHALAGFLGCIDWSRFRRRNLNEEMKASSAAFAVFGCGDAQQAIAWLLRRDTIKNGQVDPEATAIAPRFTIPGLESGMYALSFWDTATGTLAAQGRLEVAGGGTVDVDVPPIRTDLAVAVAKLA